jgi:hypothetical protein
VSGPNGRRRPPRPRIELLSAAPEQEAAAIVAAVERFLTETAPASRVGGAPANPWQRAALLEGVESGTAPTAAWGEQRTWGKRHSRRD